MDQSSAAVRRRPGQDCFHPAWLDGTMIRTLSVTKSKRMPRRPSIKQDWPRSKDKFGLGSKPPSWDKVHDAVAYLVTWGLEHRVLGAIRDIGVDEIQRGKGFTEMPLRAWAVIRSRQSRSAAIC